MILRPVAARFAAIAVPIWPTPTKPISPTIGGRPADSEPPRRSRGEPSDAVPKARAGRGRGLDMAAPGRTQPHLSDALACGGYTGYLVMGVFCACLSLPRRWAFLLRCPEAPCARTAARPSNPIKSNLVI